MGRHILLLLLLSAPHALAQSRGLGPDAPPMAQSRYDIGVQLYTAGQYAEAAREFRVARTLMPTSPQIAFNLARCLERAGALEEAYEAYGEYLALERDEKARSEVEQVRAVLKATIARRNAERVEAEAIIDHEVRPEPEPDPKTGPDDGEWRTVTGWSALGAGVAGLVVGGIFHAKAAETADAGASLGPGRQETADALEDDLNAQQVGMWIGYGLGAALVATGAALLAWPEDQTTMTLVPAADGAFASWAVRW